MAHTAEEQNQARLAGSTLAAASPVSNQDKEASIQEGPSKANSPLKVAADAVKVAQSPDPEPLASAERQDAVRKQRKRDRATLEGSEHEEICWGLKRKFAALSQEVELLSQEVAKVRREADLSSAKPELTIEEKALIAERHVKRLAEVQKRGISVILRDIMGHKWAFPFNRPVDLIMYKDYLTRVKQPMDFGTIKSRLDMGAYAMDTERFTADMRQVFENAFSYNAPGTDVHSMAMTLQDKFEERMKGLAGRVAGAETEKLKEEEELKAVARRNLQELALEGLAEHRSRLEPTFAALDTQIHEAKSEAARGCSFMTLAEKQALVDSLAELKLEEFEFAMQLVVNRHPGLLQPNSEEMDIDLEPLDSLTLRQLSAFCRFCLQGRAVEAHMNWPGLLFGSGKRGFLPSADGKTDRSTHEESKTDAHSHRTSPGTQEPPAERRDSLEEADEHAKMERAGETAKVPQGSSAQAERDGVMIQVRSIGERSWSVLDKAAMQRYHPGLSQLAQTARGLPTIPKLAESSEGGGAD